MEKLRRFLIILFFGLALTAGLIAPFVYMAQSVEAAGEDGTRDLITPTNIAVTGSTVTLVASSGDGHKFTNNGRTWVQIQNSYSETITATFVTVASYDGIALADVDVALTAGQTKIVGPFAVGLFNQTTGSDKNRVYLNWNTAVTGSVASSVTLAAFAIN